MDAKPAINPDEITRMMGVIWRIPDDETFARLMTHLCYSVWIWTRPDPFPDARELAEYMTGVGPHDGEELLSRILSFGDEKRRLN